MPNVTDTDLANAEVELAQAKLYKSRGNDLQDANNDAPPVTSLGAEGLSVVEAPMQDGFVNPSLLRLIYHAYDGRAVAIPDYMAKVRLAERFPRETWVPTKYVGKRVWFLEPQGLGIERMHLLCLLHIDQDETIRGEVIASGFNEGRCTKSNMPSVYAVEKHMELKHKDEWRALQRLRDKRVENEYRESQKAQTEAFIRLADALGKTGG